MASGANIKAGGAFIEITERGFDKVNTKLKNLADNFDKSATKIRQWSQSLFVSGVAGITAMVVAAKNFATIGEELFTTSKLLGLSVEQLQNIRYAAEQSGVSAKTMDSSIASLNNTLLEARKGNLDAMQSFAKLGLSVTQLSAMDGGERFLAFLNAVQKYKNPTQMADVAGQFGMSPEMVPLLLQGADAFGELYDESDEWFNLTEYGALRARELFLALNRCWTMVKRLSVMIGGSLAPVITFMANNIMLALDVIAKFIADHEDLFKVIGMVAGGIALVVAAIGGFGLGVAMVSKFLAIVVSGLRTATIVIGGLTRAIVMSTIAMVKGLVVGIFHVIAGIGSLAMAVGPFVTIAVVFAAAVAGAFAIVSWWFSDLKNKIRSFSEVWLTIKEDFDLAWNGIKDAVAAGDIALAMKILWAEIKLLWTTGTNYLWEKWLAWKDGFLNLWTQMQGGATQIVLNLVNGIQSAFGGLWRIIQAGFWGAMDFIKRAYIETDAWVAKKSFRIANTIKKAWGGGISDEEMAKDEEMIDRGTKEKTDALDDEFDARMAKLDEESAAQRKAWENDLQASKDMTQTAQDERKKASVDALNELYMKEEKQRKELDALTVEAANKRVAKDKEMEGKNYESNPKSWLPQRGAVSSVGSFSGLGISLMGVGSPELQTLKNIEKWTQLGAIRAGRVPNFVQ